MARIDIFKPNLLLWFYSGFMLLIVLALFSGLMRATPSVLGFMIVLLAFPPFVLGFKIGKHLYGKKVHIFIQLLILLFFVWFYTMVFSNFFHTSEAFSFLFALLVGVPLYIAFYLNRDKIKLGWKLAAMLCGAGLLFLLATFLTIGGIPLFDSSLRPLLLTNVYWGASNLTFFIGYSLLLSNIKNKWLMYLMIAISTALFLLSAFRGAIVVVLLVGTFIAYYSGKLNNKTVWIPLLTTFLLIASVGYAVSPILEPQDLVLYRVGSTHLVFDSLVQKSMPFGYSHGDFFFHGNPRDYVGELMGYGGDLTYTLTGAAVVDFGIIGVIIWMFLLGLVLQLAYMGIKKDKLFMGFYPLLLAQSLVMIETGPDPSQLLFFAIFIMIYMTMMNKKK